jgi:hypothetical protein
VESNADHITHRRDGGLNLTKRHAPSRRIPRDSPAEPISTRAIPHISDNVIRRDGTKEFKYKDKDNCEHTAVVTVTTGVQYGNEPDRRKISISVHAKGDDILHRDFHWLHLTEGYRIDAAGKIVPGIYRDEANGLYKSYTGYNKDGENQAYTLDNPNPNTVFNDLSPSAPKTVSSKEVTVYDSPNRGRLGLGNVVDEVGTYHDLYLMSGTEVYW